MPKKGQHMFPTLPGPHLASLILRLMLASIFIAQGGLKIFNHDLGTSWYSTSDESMTPVIQGAVAWSEVIAGFFLLVGFLTRVSALALIVIMVGAIYKVTWPLDFTNESGRPMRGFVHEVGYEYNYAIMAMCVCLVIMGAGLASVDHCLWSPKKNSAAPPAS
jgi:uncharacterized membrane protein YphA (DoxX/SURF4 family)